MENKRVILAVVLCLMVTVGYNYFAQYMGWLPDPAQVEQAEQQAASEPAPQSEVKSVESASALPSFAPSEGREISVDTPMYSAVLHSQGGVLRHFMLKGYNTTIEKGAPLVDFVNGPAAALAPLGVMVDGQRTWMEPTWSFAGDNLTLTDEQTGMLVFTGEVQGLRIIRELHFSAGSYLIKEKTRLVNISESPKSVRLDYTLGTNALSDSGGSYNMTRLAWFTDEEGLDSVAKPEELENGVSSRKQLYWAGVESNYFLAAIAPQDKDVAFKGRLQQGVYRVAVEKNAIGINVGAEADVETSYYIGPKLSEQLESAPNVLGASIDFGFFTMLAKPMLAMINYFYQHVGNYGVAILILTFLIKLVFFPLSQKSYKSMEQMKKLQPMMQKIREKYPDDREKQTQETMNLYKTYKVKPASGCIPMLVQIPVFFGLYQALLNAIELRHASFIAHVPFTDIPWLADLSAADPYYVTPIIMGITMVLQQRLTPSAGDPIQQKMMMAMPLVFTFMFLSFPSGLVVYWLCNNVLSIAQQWFMLRKA